MTTKEEKRDALEEKRNDQRASVQLKRKEEKKDFKKSLVKRIEDTLSDKGMNQTKLADAMNVTPQQISKWLSLSKKDESTLPDIINLIQISKALNVSLDYLCGCEEKEEEKKDVSINSFNDLLLSMWNQYEYCLNSGIACRLASASYYPKHDLTFSYYPRLGVKIYDHPGASKQRIQFIGMDMDDRFIYDFLEVFKEINGLFENEKLSFERTKNIVLDQIKDICNSRDNYVKWNYDKVKYVPSDIDDNGDLIEINDPDDGFSVPLDESDKRRYKD